MSTQIRRSSGERIGVPLMQYDQSHCSAAVRAISVALVKVNKRMLKVMFLAVSLTASSSANASVMIEDSRATAEANESRTSPASFPPAPQTAADADEEIQARTSYERFLKLLMRQPKPGTALDRVFAFHLERGSLLSFVESLQNEAQADDSSNSGVSWLVLGLIEQRQGDHQSAVIALEKAQKSRPDDFQVSWQLGRSLISLNRFAEATDALERAIEQSSEKAELLPVYQDLQRAFRGAGNPEKSREILTRMEQAFANDLRVKEQIAIGLSDDGDFESALPRYSELATLHRDPQQATQFAFAAAQLKIRLGRTDEAIRDLEQQLDKLDRDSWLHREARQRIEEALRQSQNPLALVTYYENWMRLHPDDVDGMLCLARAIASSGRQSEALQWYAKAVERAPSSLPVRKAYIDELINEEKFEEAITQYEQLYVYQPDNSDMIKVWGRLYLLRADLPRDAQKSKAAEVWRLLLKDRPDDAVELVQVAELMRESGLQNEALSLYQRAIKVSPDEPQYREDAGAVLWSLNRPEEANALWNSIAEDSRRSTATLIRLSEVRARFGLQELSLDAMTDACSLTPELTDRLRLARQLRETAMKTQTRNLDRIPEDIVGRALEQLTLADAMAESEEERSLVLEERLACLKAGKLLNSTITALATELHVDVNGDAAVTTGNVGVNKAEESEPLASRFLTLSIYAEADHQFSIATASIEKATSLQPNSVGVWTAAARLYEKTGRNADAIAAHRQLIALDRRRAHESLRKLAELEQRLGHSEASLAAGRELVNANPDNLDDQQFYAALCFELGQREEGLKSLRRMVRSSSSDASTLLKLGHELANHGDPAEAIEIYWRAMEATTDLESQMTTASSLAALHLKIHQFDRLIHRLEERGRDFDKRRGAILALATAFLAAGDPVSARSRLESMVDAGSADQFVLEMLARVCEEDGDFPAAAEYVRRSEELSPSPQKRIRLANLLVKSGHIAEAESAWTSLLQSSVPNHELIHLIDEAITARDLEFARTLCRRLVQKDSNQWEALVRLAILEWIDGNEEESMRLAREVLSLNLSADVKSSQEVWLRSQSTSERATTSTVPNPIPARWERTGPWMFVFWPEDTGSDSPLSEILRRSSELTLAGLAKDFGEARLLCRGVLWAQAKRQNREHEFLDELSGLIPSGHEAGSDLVFFYILQAKQTNSSTFVLKSLDAASRLAQSKSIELQAMYLFVARFAAEHQQALKPPYAAEKLTDFQLKQLIESYEAVLFRHPAWTLPTSGREMFTGLPDPQIIVNGARDAAGLQQVEDLIERLLSDSSSAQQVYAGLWVSLLAKRCTASETLRQLERVLLLSQMQSEANPDAAALPDSSTVLLALAMNAQERNEIESLSEILEWWLTHRPDSSGAGKSAMFNSQGSMASQTHIELNRFADEITGSGKPFLSSAGRMESEMSATKALRIDHLMAPWEIVLWETLTRQSATRDSPPPSVHWALHRLKSADKEQQLTLQMCLASAAWARRSHQDVTSHMEAIAALRPADVRLKISLMELYAEENRYKDALAVLDNGTDQDSSLIKAREIVALEFAATANNGQRAVAAETHLVGLELTPQEIQFVVERLKAVGLTELASEIHSRTERMIAASAEVPVSTVSTPPIVLLETYSRQGNIAAAVQVAQQLIRRTQGGGTPWRNTQYGTPEQIRERAFQVLKQSGELDRMIAREKAQLEKSPHSRILMQKLIEYLIAAERHDKVVELRERIIDGMKGNSTESLRERAEQLRLVGKTSEACDTWLQIIAGDSVMFWNHSIAVETLMADAGRLSDLTHAIIRSENIPPQKYVRASDLFSLLSRLTDNPRLHPDAAMLLGFIVERHPESIVDAIRSIENKQAWQTPAMFELLIRLYAPQTKTQRAAGRYLWPETYESHSSTDDDRPTVSLTLLNGLLESDVRRTQLQQVLQDSEKAFPEWPGIALLKLILALHRENSEAEIQEIVRSLTGNADKRLPEALAFELANLMAGKDLSAKTQAIPLLEASLQDVRARGIEQGSPAFLLLTDLYVDTQQQARGWRFLLENVPAEITHEDQQEDDQRIRFTGTRLVMSAAMIELGEHVAAWNFLNEISAPDSVKYVNSVRSLGYSYMNLDWFARHSWETLRNQIVRGIEPRIITTRLKQEVDADLENLRVDPRMQLAFERNPLKGDSSGLWRLNCPLMSAMMANSKVSYSPSAMQELNDAVTMSLNSSRTNGSTALLGLTLLLRENKGRLEPSLVAALQESLNQPVPESTAVTGTEDESQQIREGWNARLHSDVGLACVAAWLAPEKSSVVLAERMFERAIVAARQLAAGSADEAHYESAIWVLRAEFLSAAGDSEGAAKARKAALETLKD